MALQQKQLLLAICMVLLLGNMFTFGFIYLHTSGSVSGRAQNSAEASFCINNPPSITVPCNATMSQGQTYVCQLNLSDPDGGVLTVQQFAFGQRIFNVSSTGLINFTPNQASVGNYSTTFLVTDDSGCLLNTGSVAFNYSIANVNDPPFLIKPIPDQQFAANTTLNAFFLSDYFGDPDNDPLTYTATIPTGVVVTISNTSQVILSSNVCDTTGQLVQFTAMDPYNLTADSNQVTIKVSCVTPSGGVGNTGGGGGGGGGASSVCRQNWQCEEWFACLPTNMQWLSMRNLIMPIGIWAMLICV